MRAIHEPSPERQPRRIIPPLGALYDALSPLALPMIRVTAGLLLLPHGSQKLFGWFGGKGMQATPSSLPAPASSRAGSGRCSSHSPSSSAVCAWHWAS
jgi:uncharacterized membrane protein YphA (DoxX/SURF4 family)